MKKAVSLFLVLCLLLSVTIVYADNQNSNSMVKYDMDDFAEYLIKFSDGKNTKDLIEEYFKDQTQDNKYYSEKTNTENFTETEVINGKKVKTSKVLKTVMINDTQSITFYANGYFGIGEKIVEKLDETVEQNAIASYSNEWAQYQYDAYNDIGVWMGATLVGQSFKYDGEYLAINSEPTGDYSYNSTLYSFIDHSTFSTKDVGVLESSYISSHSSLTIKPRLSDENILITAYVDMFPSGEWSGDGGTAIVH